MLSSTSKINIRDIYRDIYNKKTRRMEVYNDVLMRCHRKITELAKREHYCMLFDVPEFVMSAPFYDLKTCIVYLIKSMRENGFYVKYYYPKLLFISWDIKDIHDKHLVSDVTLDIDKELVDILQADVNGNKHNNLVSFEQNTPKIGSDIVPSTSRNSMYTNANNQRPYSEALHATASLGMHPTNTSVTTHFPFKNASPRYKASGKYVLNLD